MSQHTPGPWKQGPFQVYIGNIVDRDEGYTEIADICLGQIRQWQMTDGQRQANARLIAAAPEMYSLLEWLTGLPLDCGHLIQDSYDCLDCQNHKEARAILAKIDGEVPE